MGWRVFPWLGYDVVTPDPVDQVPAPQLDYDVITLDPPGPAVVPWLGRVRMVVGAVEGAAPPPGGCWPDRPRLLHLQHLR